MLITPATPKITAKPIAEITKIAATLNPIRTWERSACVIELARLKSFAQQPAKIVDDEATAAQNPGRRLATHS